jgi:hypothetical protein
VQRHPPRLLDREQARSFDQIWFTLGDDDGRHVERRETFDTGENGFSVGVARQRAGREQQRTWAEGERTPPGQRAATLRFLRKRRGAEVHRQGGVGSRIVRRIVAPEAKSDDGLVRCP